MTFLGIAVSILLFYNFQNARMMLQTIPTKLYSIL